MEELFRTIEGQGVDAVPEPKRRPILTFFDTGCSGSTVREGALGVGGPAAQAKDEWKVLISRADHKMLAGDEALLSVDKLFNKGHIKFVEDIPEDIRNRMLDPLENHSEPNFCPCRHGYFLQESYNTQWTKREASQGPDGKRSRGVTDLGQALQG